jgi:hypothetical protein
MNRSAKKGRWNKCVVGARPSLRSSSGFTNAIIDATCRSMARNSEVTIFQNKYDPNTYHVSPENAKHKEDWKVLMLTHLHEVFDVRTCCNTSALWRALMKIGKPFVPLVAGCCVCAATTATMRFPSMCLRRVVFPFFPSWP